MYTTVLSSILIDHSENDMNIISLFVSFVLSVLKAYRFCVHCCWESGVLLQRKVVLWRPESMCSQLYCFMFAQSRVSLTSEEMQNQEWIWSGMIMEFFERRGEIYHTPLIYADTDQLFNENQFFFFLYQTFFSLFFFFDKARPFCLGWRLGVIIIIGGE